MNSIDLFNHYETLKFVLRATPDFGYAIQRESVFKTIWYDKVEYVIWSYSSP